MKKRVDLVYKRTGLSSIEGKVVHVKEFLDSVLDSVPEEYQNEVEIEVDIYEEYGSERREINFYYHREETPEEGKERELLESERAEMIKKRELAQLEILQNKYKGQV